MKLNPKPIHRRHALAALAGAGAIAVVSRSTPHADAATASCLTPSPALEEGPFFVEEKLWRSDIRPDPATGVVQQGAVLTLSINIQNQLSGVCEPLAGAYVDVWHANWDGVYSDEAMENTSGQKYLRGYQNTDDSGNVEFTTIYPGWYSGRTPYAFPRADVFGFNRPWRFRNPELL